MTHPKYPGKGPGEEAVPKGKGEGPLGFAIEGEGRLLLLGEGTLGRAR